MRKFIVLFTLTSIYSQFSIFAQYTGINAQVIEHSSNEYHLIVISVNPYSPAYTAGIRYGDILIEIKDKAAHDVKDLYEAAREGQFSCKVLRAGSIISTIITPLPYDGESVCTEARLAFTFSVDKKAHLPSIADKWDKGPEVEFFIDTKVDLTKYKTFDFEWNDTRNPIQEKNIGEIIEKKLVSKGFTRDENEPDLLIFISFFEGKKDQYVPPTEQVTTRYRTRYNVYTKQRETHQYIESSTKGDYTQSTYFAELSLSFADAKKMKNETTKVPPMVWSAYYAFEKTTERINRDDFINNITDAMFVRFPFLYIEGVFFVPYYYSGIIFDNKDITRVVIVIPDSPADKAGIKVGDIITGTDYGSIKPVAFNHIYYNFLNSSYYTVSHFYETRIMAFYSSWKFNKIKGLKYIYADDNGPKNMNINFTVIRQGEKQKIPVKVIHTKAYSITTK